MHKLTALTYDFRKSKLITDCSIVILRKDLSNFCAYNIQFLDNALKKVVAAEVFIFFYFYANFNLIIIIQ